MKCEKCGSEDMKKDGKGGYVCRSCLHVQAGAKHRAYTYPLADDYASQAKRR